MPTITATSHWVSPRRSRAFSSGVGMNLVVAGVDYSSRVFHRSSDKYAPSFVTRKAGADNGLVDFHVFLTRFGIAVKRRRLEKGWTQYELAAKVGVEQPSVHRIEKGRQGWDSKTVFSLAEALECSLADLFIEVEQVMPKQLPPEASGFARTWMLLPHDMREDYRRRIEALVYALRQPVPDERKASIEKPKRAAAR